jgi:hypothetical protein
MSPILIGAIIGGIIGLVVVVLMFFIKDQKYNRIMKTITEPVEYSALYHYASFKRYKNSMKFFDSFGVLYLVGKTVYYKTGTTVNPVSFNLDECSVQQESDWRMLKWFSITTRAGEKFYFNSQKMGLFKNNSEETLKGLAALQSKKAS